MSEAMRDELSRRMTRAKEAGRKAAAADRLAKAYGKLQREARRDHDVLYDLWMVEGVETPPADAQQRMWDDDPLALAVEEALKELLGEAYRTPAAVAAAEPTAIEVVVEAIEPGGRETLTDAEKAELGDALGELLGGPVTLEGPIVEPSADEMRAEVEQAAAIEPTAVVGTRWNDYTSEVALTFALDGGGTDVVRAVCNPSSFPHGTWWLEFRGDLVSETGFTSYGFDPASTGDPLIYMTRLARHLARLRGGDVAESPFAPEWRSRPLSILVGLKKGRVAALRSGGLRTLGDLQDAIDLGCGRCRTKHGQTVVSEPCWAEAVAALDAFVRTIAAPVPLDGPTAVAQLGTWSTVPLADVVKRPDLVAALKAGGLSTLGGLADACDLCGCLANALDDLTPLDADQVEHDVRTWSRKRPGFPLEKLQLPDDAQAEPDGAALEALHAALYPDGQNPPWRKLANDGAGDDEIRAVLATLWPESPEYFESEPGPCGLGYTVRGGDRPAFWLGDAKPNAASMPRRATLLGDALVAAIRRELRIRTPEEIDGASASAAPKKPAKKARPTAAAGARP